MKHSYVLAMTLLALAGCQSAPPPVIITKTVPVPIEVPVAVPAALSQDCPPAALAGSSVGDVLARLAAAEAALAACRDRLAKVRSLGAPAP